MREQPQCILSRAFVTVRAVGSALLMRQSFSGPNKSTIRQKRATVDTGAYLNMIVKFNLTRDMMSDTCNPILSVGHLN